MREAKILIIKLGALGDVVRTSYFLPGIRKQFTGNVHITWITKHNAIPLLASNPHINRLTTIEAFTTEEGGPNGRLYDWIISLDDEVEACTILKTLTHRKLTGAYLSDGHVRYTDDAAPWFDMGLVSKFGKEIADRLKVENQLTHDDIFSKILGINACSPEFYNDPSLEAPAINALAENPPHLVGLNLSAGKRWPGKRLHMREAFDLINGLQARNRACILIGGEDDSDYLDQIACTTKVAKLKPLPLGIFAQVVKRLAVLITSDTLALHLAIAQKVPTVSYYAPTSAAEINLFDTGEKVVSTSPDYCSYSPDASNKSITGQRILEAFDRLTSSLATRK